MYVLIEEYRTWYDVVIHTSTNILAVSISYDKLDEYRSGRCEGFVDDYSSLKYKIIEVEEI